MEYKKAINNLIIGIGKDYIKWMGLERPMSDEMRKIKENMIREFKTKIYIKSGIKFDKIISNGSVWGFVAKADGTHKNIPYKTGDVFKASGWSSPAKHQRGNIFSKNQNYYAWTSPNYLI